MSTNRLSDWDEILIIAETDQEFAGLLAARDGAFKCGSPLLDKLTSMIRARYRQIRRGDTSWAWA